MKRLVAAVLLLSSVSAVANEFLAQEVSRLRDGLPIRDPSRPALTLRLADVTFDQIGELTRKGDANPANLEKAMRLRRKTLGYYREALTGEEGRFTPLSGSVKTKVQFQMARLHSELGEATAAAPLWRELAEQTQLVDIRREASLRLAEAAENGSSSAAILEAEKYFAQALALCAGGDSCDYIRYRRAWLFYRTARNGEAIAEMKLSVADARGAPREESLRDLILFFSKSPSNLDDATTTVESLAQRLGRPGLMTDLSDAFFAAGDRASGVKVLEYVHRAFPSLARRVRLLEEHYGFRAWERFREHLEQLSEDNIGGLAGYDEQARTEVEKILRRLAVQLDGERIGGRGFAAEFQALALAYLRIFPQGPARKSMIDGWLVAESDPTKKLARLMDWISEEAAVSGNGGEVLRLRELRASIAQKAALPAIVAEEMAAVVQLPEAKARFREFRYLQARALYEAKEYGAALPIFRALAAPAPGGAPGEEKHAVESQNLALDILGLQKNYAEVVSQAALWTHHEKKAPNLMSELLDIARIAESARFELAVLAGETSSALDSFEEMCVSKKLLPQSCANARILAVKLGRQASLLNVLAAQGDSAALASESEASGRFAEAAALFEAQAKSGAVPVELLRIALLYELGAKLSERDRLILAAISAQGTKKLKPSDEPLWFETLQDVPALLPRAERLAWSDTYSAHVADALESSGKGNAQTRSRILASRDVTGPSWRRLVAERVHGLAREAASIGFYGRDGQRKFELRMAKLKKLVEAADFYLPAADPRVRTEVMAVLMESHSEIANRILESPVPSSVTGEALDQVRASLNEMAVPFQAKAKGYADLAREQAAKIEDTAVRATWESRIAMIGLKNIDQVVAQASVAARDPSTASKSWSAEDVASRERAFAVLKVDPADAGALGALKSLYERNGSRRLSAYFQGRILAATKAGATR